MECQDVLLVIAGEDFIHPDGHFLLCQKDITAP